MWANWINFVLGIWMIIAAFISGITTSKSGSLWNDLIVGTIVVILAYLATTKRKAICWVNVIIGLWLFVSAFIPSIVGSKSGNLWNDLLVGIIIGTFALIAALQKSK